ncbi:MAG: hypothetical protein IKD37_07715 [Clostridia bacterium]|nr:hypothetical protein [Clostridia bacterium]
MKTVYVLLSRTNTVCGRLIRMTTACRYNHVSISLDADRQTFYSFARRRMHNPLVAGFIREGLHSGIFYQNRMQPCALYALEVSEEIFAALEAKIETFFAQYDRYRYNFLGVPLCYLGIPYARRHHYLCSQFVAQMLADTGLCTLPKPLWLMQPMDFIAIPELRLIYTGPLGMADQHPIPQGEDEE